MKEFQRPLLINSSEPTQHRHIMEKAPNIEQSHSGSITTDQEQGSTHTLDNGSRHLHRKLGVKEVQLFALSAAIGTSKPSAS